MRILNIGFIIVPCESVYKDIHGISFMGMLDNAASTVHMKMKYHNDSSNHSFLKLT